jgi:hypothetical protein
MLGKLGEGNPTSFTLKGGAVQCALALRLQGPLEMGTHFFWDPVEDNIIQERDDTGAVTADYTTEPYLYGDLISQCRSGTSRFHCFDNQGSTRALTDSSGTVTYDDFNLSYPF